jgi:hypothetical protein
VSSRYRATAAQPHRAVDDVGFLGESPQLRERILDLLKSDQHGLLVVATAPS